MKAYPNEFKYIGGGWYQVIEYPLWPSKGVRHISKVHGKKNLPPKVDGVNPIHNLIAAGDRSGTMNNINLDKLFS